MLYMIVMFLAVSEIYVPCAEAYYVGTPVTTGVKAADRVPVRVVVEGGEFVWGWQEPVGQSTTTVLAGDIGRVT